MFLVQEKRPWHGRFIPPSLWKRLRVFPSGAETPAMYRYRFLCISGCQKNMKGKGLREDFRAPAMGPLILRPAHVLSLSLSPFYRMYNVSLEGMFFNLRFATLEFYNMQVS